MRHDEEFDFTIETLGSCKIPSPIHLSNVIGDRIANYVTNDDFIRFRLESKVGEQYGPFKREQLIEKAGPREKIFFFARRAKISRQLPMIDKRMWILPQKLI